MYKPSVLKNRETYNYLFGSPETDGEKGALVSLAEDVAAYRKIREEEGSPSLNSYCVFQIRFRNRRQMVIERAELVNVDGDNIPPPDQVLAEMQRHGSKRGADIIKKRFGSDVFVPEDFKSRALAVLLEAKPDELPSVQKIISTLQDIKEKSKPGIRVKLNEKEREKIGERFYLLSEAAFKSGNPILTGLFEDALLEHIGPVRYPKYPGTAVVNKGRFWSIEREGR